MNEDKNYKDGYNAGVLAERNRIAKEVGILKESVEFHNAKIVVRGFVARLLKLIGSLEKVDENN